MCGLVGVLSPGRPLPELEAQVAEAVRLLRHRGPDDRGLWSGRPGVALGHARLAILDLSAHGHQPMVGESSGLVLSFNGEIYNFREIRRELESLGRQFRGTGDSEVLLAAFESWGPAAVDRLIGMFAIAVWDPAEQTLSLYRDRLGVKPLYYAEEAGSFAFASELRAWQAFTEFDRRIDSEALGEYLQFGYIAGPRSIYRGIRKLPPGHRLEKRLAQPARIQQYWNPTALQPIRLPKDPGAIADELEALLRDAFSYRMIADVPVGVFLSGGVDSSLVAALLAREHGRGVKTYTIGFGDPTKDESSWARRVADHCGTSHTEFRVEAREGLEVVKDWGRLFDEPFGDSSGIPTFIVARLARENVKVALSADGGDEFFSGYEVYDTIFQRQRQRRWTPAPVRQAAGLAAEGLLPGPFDETASSWGLRARRLAAVAKASQPADALLAYHSYFRESEVRSLIGEYATPRPRPGQLAAPLIDQLSLWDIQYYLPEDVLTKVDRMTMAVSLEGREPLLDHRILQFALSTSAANRRGELGGKSLLKQVLYRHVPRELVDRPKQGFSVPLASWLRGELSELLESHLSAERIRSGGLFDPVLVSRLVANFRKGNPALATPVWFLLAFELWREKWGHA